MIEFEYTSTTFLVIFLIIFIIFSIFSRKETFKDVASSIVTGISGTADMSKRDEQVSKSIRNDGATRLIDNDYLDGSGVDLMNEYNEDIKVEHDYNVFF